MTQPVFSHADTPGLRTIETDVPFPVPAELLDAHPEQHDWAAPAPAANEAPERDEEALAAVPAPPDTCADCGQPGHDADDHAIRPDDPEDVHPEQASAAPAGPPPVPLFAGTFAIYDDGHGGIMLVVKKSDGEIVNKHIPSAMLKMAEKLGGIGGAFGGLFGGA